MVKTKCDNSFSQGCVQEELDCDIGKADTDRDATTACEVCAAGQYALQTKAVVCTECAPGFASTDPTDECDACEVGTYSGNGAAACSSCEAGTSDHDSDSASACVVCGEGTFSLEGATSCTTPCIIDLSRSCFCSLP